MLYRVWAKILYKCVFASLFVFRFLKLLCFLTSIIDYYFHFFPLFRSFGCYSCHYYYCCCCYYSLFSSTYFLIVISLPQGILILVIGKYFLFHFISVVVFVPIQAHRHHHHYHSNMIQIVSNVDWGKYISSYLILYPFKILSKKYENSQTHKQSNERSQPTSQWQKTRKRVKMELGNICKSTWTPLYICILSAKFFLLIYTLQYVHLNEYTKLQQMPSTWTQWCIRWSTN